MKYIKTFLFFIVLYSHCPFAQGLLINEFLASNVSTFPEMYDFDDYTDWIELYNSDTISYELSGYFLTDDLSEPLKWRISDETIIGPDGYLIIWADDYNESPNVVYTRPYWPWDDYLTQHYHTNFKLNKDGEELGLFQAEQTDTYILIDEGSTWKYLDNGTDQGLAWATLDFDDSNWYQGNAELGYGDGDEATVVSYGPDEGEKHITTYFRKTFDINDLYSIQSLTIQLKRDDGAVVYLNGLELLRSNMPAGIISYDTPASSTVGGSDEDTFFEWTISSNNIANGQNVVAVEIHQVSGSSSDISFDFQMIGTGYNSPVLVDSIAFGDQLTDVSFGRTMQTNIWNYFGEPTPGSSNNRTPINIAEISGSVLSSLESGFYVGVQAIELSTPSENAQIYYTIDGSRPGSTTNLYSGPIFINSTTVLKARTLELDMLQGEILTATYLIDEPNFLSTISLIAEPETLWDSDIGIYENEYKQREIPVTIQYFPSSDEHGFSVNAGARLGGLNIWTKPQKPFTIYLRNRFGDDFISYQLF